MTGASGCIGHYLAETLIRETPHELFLLVREPTKLRINCQARPGVTVLQGDLRDINQFASLLRTIQVAVLTAAVWGGAPATFDINVAKTVQLVELLDPQVCQQVLYFSTASLLNRNGQLLKEAASLGIDYIRSKYVCFQQLSRLTIAPRITVLFPTLVFGGDGHKPYSHLSADIHQLPRWINLIRFFRIDGSFHFIHAQDIAQVVRYLIDHPPELPQSRQLVLGNAPLTVKRAIAECCAYFGKPIYFQIPLSAWLTELFIVLFRIQMDSWSRFCLKYRHFTYPAPVNPDTFGLPGYCPTIADLLRVSGLPGQNNPPLRQQG